MDDWISDINYSSNISPSSFRKPNMNFVAGARNHRISNINLLPVIKEENSYNENEIELRNVFFVNSELKDNYKNRKTFDIIKNKKIDDKFEERLREKPRSFYKLPPLMNINCMMNIDIKQSQPIWETTFGKKLIYGKEGSQESSKISSEVQKLENVSNTSLSQKLLKNSVLNKKTNSKGSDRVQSISYYSSKNKRKQQQKATKENQITEKHSQTGSKSETSSKLTLGTQKSNRISNQDSIAYSKTSTESSLIRKQHLLTECIRSTLENSNSNLSCDYCSESFKNVDEFLSHILKHEDEKQICLLCNKIFYNGKCFVQHLLTHESADGFSCQICKKYFPSLKKYKRHYAEFHEVSYETSVVGSDTNQNEMRPKKPLRVYKCKRCEKFVSESAYKTHRRNHIRMELMGAYLINKNV